MGVELARRGYHCIHGDRELAYQGDPATGEPVAGITGIAVHAHHIWNVDRLSALIADHTEEMTFFCGGSRNFADFIDLFDGVFVLEVDAETLVRRLDNRPGSEWGGPGRREERDFIIRLNSAKADVPRQGIRVDATAPLSQLVDSILTLSKKGPSNFA